MDDEALMRELHKLEDLNDDLFLEDVGTVGTARGGKFGKRLRDFRQGGSRGFGRAKQSRGRVNDKGDIFNVSAQDLDDYDNWDLEHKDCKDLDYLIDKANFESRSAGFRGQGRSRGSVGKKSKPAYRGRGKSAGVMAREFVDSRISDTFDIESKMQRDSDRNLEHSSNWSRDSRDSPGFGKHSDDIDHKDPPSPRFIQHRNDPRLVGKTEYDSRFGLFKRNDPRLVHRPDGPSSDSSFGPGRKDSRMQQQSKDARFASQQVDKTRKNKEVTEKDSNEKSDQEIPFVPVKVDLRNTSKGPDHLRKFENRFLPISDDPRLAANKKVYNSHTSDKTLFEKISSNPALLENQIPGISDDIQAMEPKKTSQHVRRGPRSPSPLTPTSPVAKKDRNGSPVSSRKTEHSTSRTSRSRWERSLSPVRGHVDHSPSPHRRSGHSERNLSRERLREHNNERRDRSMSPRRERSRRDRSSSPRRRRRSLTPNSDHNNERSRDRSYGRSPGRSRDRSVSSRRSPSPRQHRGSGQRETIVGRDRGDLWKGKQNVDHQQLQPLPPSHLLGAQPRYPIPQPTGYELMPPAIYSEQYRPPLPNYGPPQPTGGPPPQPGYGVPYQQHYHYDNYGYPQPAYGEYQAPAPPPGSWGGERGIMYPDMSQPPPLPSQPPVLPPPPTTAPPPIAPPSAQVDIKAEEAKKEAIKNEVLQQKQTLSKQREEYVRKSSMISRELQLLRNQEEELMAEKSRDNDRILRENHKLQLEIQNKLKAINNVIDMLTGIIGDKKEIEEEKLRAKTEPKMDKKHPKTPPDTPPKSSSESSQEPRDSKVAEPPVPGENTELLLMPTPVPVPVLHGTTSGTIEDKKPVFNYVHYDPEMHWCRVCDVFPRTAKEFLNHLHSTEHKDVTLERKLVDMPWHKVQSEEEVAYLKGAPTKRTPIRGLQFFISATAWYCKLCDTWIGDLHCASLHLKSKSHTENYVNFTEQNPHWETDWLADREKAYERKSDERRQVRDTQRDVPATPPQSVSTKPILLVKEEKTKKSKKERKKERKTKDEKDGKKKKHKKKSKKKMKTSSGTESSSSTSSSNSSEEESEGEEDKSKSIRVSMRNKFKALGTQPMEKELPSAYSLKPTGWQNLGIKEEAARIMELEQLEKERIFKEERERLEREEQQFEIQRIERETHEKQRLEKEEREVRFRRFPQKEDKMLLEWMGTNKEQVSEGEKQILSNIKDRVKLRQEEEKTRKREERDHYYEKGHYEEGYRRRRRGDSPDGRAGKRGRSRSPEERRWDRDRSKSDKYKRSPQRPATGTSRFRDDSFERKTDGDKKNNAKRPDTSELEEAETKFEKQAAEAAARLKKKDKKPPVTNMPKSKLPFIGRMPIMKHLAKKKGDDESEKNVDGKTPFGPKLPENSTKGRLVGPALPPGMLLPRTEAKSEMRPEDHGAGAQVQDMDIDDEDSNGAVTTVVEERVPIYAGPAPLRVEPLPAEKPPALYLDVEVPPDMPKELLEVPPGIDAPLPPEPEEEPAEMAETVMNPRTKKPGNDTPLPKDFQEALNILFPGEKKPTEEPKPEPESRTPPEHQWNQDIIPPGPHQMPGGYGQMIGMHSMYPNMGPQGVGQQGMGPQNMGPQNMGPQNMGPQNMGPQNMGGPPSYHQMPHQGMMGPQDMPRHMVSSQELSGPPLPPHVLTHAELSHKQPANSDSDHSEDEGDKMNSGMWGEDDLAMLGMDAEDMAAQNF